MEIPSTPPTRADPFSSPARGVGWSPGASVTLLDGMPHDKGVFCPRSDSESVWYMSVSPVRRAYVSLPVSSSTFDPRTPRSLPRDASFQSSEPFTSHPATRFAAPASPVRPQVIQSPGASPSKVSFYGVGLDPGEFDKHYQLASPAGSIYPLSPTRRSATPVAPASISYFSSPIFPPPVSPPSFATSPSANAHTLSYYESSSPYHYSRAVPALPPSSPIPYISSPFVDDPFLAHPQPEGSEAPEPLGEVGSPNYELPSIDSTFIPRPSSLVHQRDRRGVLSTGATKTSNTKGKASARGRKRRPNVPSSGFVERVEPLATSSNTLDPMNLAVSSIHTLAPNYFGPNICTPTQSNFQAPLSSRESSSQFMFPTPATTLSLSTPSATSSVATPSTINSLATPGTSTLLCSAEISNAPTSKRKWHIRFATPSPVPETELVRDLVMHGSRNERIEPLQADNGIDSTSQDPLTRQEFRNTGNSDLLFGRKRKYRENEYDGNSQIGKRVKEMKRQSKVKDEPRMVKDELDESLAHIMIDRPTRSRTRAMAALVAAGPSKASRDEALDRAAQRAPITRISLRTKVAGRAPSRVIVKSEDEGIEGSLNHAEQEPENRNGFDGDYIDVSKELPPSSRPSTNIIPPSSLLPRPEKFKIFMPDGNIVRRNFPGNLPIKPKYARWYRRFPVSAYFQQEDPVYGAPKSVEMQPRPSGLSLVPNPAEHFNLYTPRFVHGTSQKKVGLCSICIEPVWRGGEGKPVLLNTKISAYNYHMQYYHGICSKTGLPFSPPTAFRCRSRRTSKPLERSEIEEGKCHSCKQWVPIESLKDMDALVPELFWWKHAASCHGITRVKGDEDPYLEDPVYLKLVEFESKLNDNVDIEKRTSANSLSLSIPGLLEPCSDSETESGMLSSTRMPSEDIGVLSANIFGTSESGDDLTDLEDG